MTVQIVKNVNVFVILNTVKNFKIYISESSTSFPPDILWTDTK
jgi:hypothetical protein